MHLLLYHQNHSLTSASHSPVMSHPVHHEPCPSVGNNIRNSPMFPRHYITQLHGRFSGGSGYEVPISRVNLNHRDHEDIYQEIENVNELYEDGEETAT